VDCGLFQGAQKLENVRAVEAGHIRPATMMISANLLDPRMRIEIEVTALKQPG
jgi:hypothetical protein